MKKRKEDYEQLYTSWQRKSKKRVQYFLMCEIDILADGNLALPLEAFEYLDAAIVSIHSAFTQDRKTVTERIIKALNAHPKVRIFGHPSGRLLGSRDGVDANWQEVFDVVKENDQALEINAYPDRLDLSDALVYEARQKAIKFTIDTDSHAVEHMDLMQYGVSVARRGWATKGDIANALRYTEFKKWLIK
jgi:DNA polymerase (family 10)